jgi:hypothetical protein
MRIEQNCIIIFMYVLLTMPENWEHVRIPATKFKEVDLLESPFYITLL